MEREITKDENGVRIDIWCTTQFEGVSRARIQEEILNGKIKVNNAFVKKDYKLRAYDRVTFPDVLSVSEDLSPLPAQPLIVLGEKEGIIALYKPTGWNTHRPRPDIKEDPRRYVADWLHQQYPSTRYLGEPLRAGIAHRIDKPVSGILLAASEIDAWKYLLQIFSERRIEKKYHALVIGNPSDSSLTIEFPIAHKGFGKVSALPLHKRMHIEDEIDEKDNDEYSNRTVGKHAVTKATIISRWHAYSLWDISLITGRTHQIRAHFAAYGYPIAGDVLYTSSPVNKKKFPRIMLQSTETTFLLPSGKQWHIAVPHDKDFAEIIESLGAPLPPREGDV